GAGQAAQGGRRRPDGKARDLGIRIGRAVLRSAVAAGAQPVEPLLQSAQQVARTLRISLLPVEASASDEIDVAFATIAREHAEALIVTGDPMFFLERARIVEFAASHKLPSIYQWHAFAAIGGLMSYGPDQNDLYRRTATYVDKILRA